MLSLNLESISRSSALALLLFFVLLFFGAITSASAQMAYLPSPNAPTISVIDLARNSLVATVSVGNGPTGVAIAQDGSTVLITNTTDNTVSVISAATNTVTATIAVGHKPMGVVILPDGSKAYVANNTDSTISVINMATNTVTTTIPLVSRVGNIPAEGPTSLAAAPDGSHVYVLNVEDESVSVIATSNDGFEGAISLNLAVERQLPGGGIAVSPDGTKLFASNGEGYSVISTAANSILTNFNQSSPNSIAFSPDGKTAYLSINTILVVDGQSGEFQNIFEPIPPNGFAITLNSLAITPDGSRIYSTSFQSTNLTATDAQSGAFDAEFTIPAGVAAIGSFIGPMPSSALLSSVLPGARSVQLGASPTIFSTMINTSGTDLTHCSISLPNGGIPGLSVDYQPTNPQNNAPVGTPNTPLTIPARGSQSFILSFTASAAVAAETQPLVYACDNTAPAPFFFGLNTVDLLFSSDPVPDIIAESATVSGDGIVTIPPSTQGPGVFALATTNIGVTALIEVSIDTGAANLPVTATICQTNPATAQCLSPPQPSISVGFSAGLTPTFSAFVTASAPVALQPAVSRLFVRFKDPTGVSHGSTSVAVQTATN